MANDNLKWSLVSVKGIAMRDRSVVLARNARNEWELPGGKLESGETLSECLEREFDEELGIRVEWGSVVDVVHHHFHKNIIVVIVGCSSIVSPNGLRLSDEHSDARWFEEDQLSHLNLVPHYRAAIERWSTRWRPEVQG